MRQPAFFSRAWKRYDHHEYAPSRSGLRWRKSFLVERLFEQFSVVIIAAFQYTHLMDGYLVEFYKPFALG